MRIPGRNRRSQNSLDSQNVHLRHDFSATDGECTQYNSPCHFFRKVSTGNFSDGKVGRRRIRIPKMETGKSGLLIAKKFIYAMTSFPATEGEVYSSNFPSYFFRKVQNFEEKNRNHQKKEENLASCLSMPLKSFPTTDGECTRLIFLNNLGLTGIL